MFLTSSLHMRLFLALQEWKWQQLYQQQVKINLFQDRAFFKKWKLIMESKLRFFFCEGNAGTGLFIEFTGKCGVKKVIFQPIQPQNVT